MAHFVYDDPSITFNGVDITDFVTQCTITQNYVTNRILTFGQSGRTDIISSKQDNSVTIALVQDFDAGGVDATVGAAVGGKGTLVIKPGTAAASATNPEWTGVASIIEYMPLDGAPGEVVNPTFNWPIDGAWAKVVV